MFVCLPVFKFAIGDVSVSRACWQNYVDYHRCINIKGEDHPACKYFFKVFKTWCPFRWVEKWDLQREDGIFPVKLE